MNLRFALALALVALATAHSAQAQKACVALEDLGDTLLYTMPIAYDAVRTSCQPELKPDGFLARKGDAFIAKFRARQDSAWPGALRVLKIFLAPDGTAKGKGGSDADITAMIASLPDSSLRPLVDGLVGQMIANEIRPESCGKIERGIELVSPLPAENVAGLLTFIIELAEIKNPQICKAAPARPAR
jgi:hypothetical protein